MALAVGETFLAFRRHSTGLTRTLTFAASEELKTAAEEAR